MKKAVLAAVVAVAAIAAGAASPAQADYGSGTQYQVEISANNVSGGNFWFWAALGPGQESDYENTDCIHTSSFLGGSGTDGASHTAGSLTGWSNAGGKLELDGVSIVGGAATADFFVDDTPHSSWFGMIVTAESVPLFPLNHLLTWSGRGVQVQIAP